eukprot:scaffold1498_cov314-Prasinococcus_capsulatus_cf.AAC.3
MVLCCVLLSIAHESKVSCLEGIFAAARGGRQTATRIHGATSFPVQVILLAWTGMACIRESVAHHKSPSWPVFDVCSVLDATSVERLDADTFRARLAGISFFGIRVEPVLTVRVTVNEAERGCTISLLECELDGSNFVKAQNDKFWSTMTNKVSWQEATDPPSSMKTINSDVDLCVEVEVPRAFRLVPGVKIVASTGSRVLQTVLNTLVPSFCKQLESDYLAWAAGDDSRKPVGSYLDQEITDAKRAAE